MRGELAVAPVAVKRHSLPFAPSVPGPGVAPGQPGLCQAVPFVAYVRTTAVCPALLPPTCPAPRRAGGSVRSKAPSSVSGGGGTSVPRAAVGAAARSRLPHGQGALGPSTWVLQPGGRGGRVRAGRAERGRRGRGEHSVPEGQVFKEAPQRAFTRLPTVVLWFSVVCLL